MYFKNFPRTYFSLDNYKSATLFTNLLIRTKFLDEVLSNYVFYDKYNIKDGESPEVTSDVFYGDSELHWTILHANNILDPRFGWVFSPFQLKKYTEGKYANINAVHHYEDANLFVTNANLTIVSSTTLSTLFDVNAVIENNTSSGVAIITAKNSGTSINVLTSTGGFISGDQVVLSSNNAVSANIVSVTINSGIPITNVKHEDRENEKRRSIQVLKAEVVGEAIQEFQAVMKK